VTLREFVERWLDAKEHTVRPATFRRYSDLMRKHVLPMLGSVRLTKLGTPHLQRLYAELLESGLSPTTVHHIHVTLHGALKQALRWGMIDRNSTELIDPPRRTQPETQTWSLEESQMVLAAGDQTNLGALWRLALLTGMRRGEILGLKWEDIDFKSGTLSVRRTLSRGRGGTWELGQPKTAAGRRSIALPADCIDALKRHRVQQAEVQLRLGPLWEDHGFVFTGHTGRLLHINSLDAQFRKLIETAGVPRIRFHDLRHTSATLMLLIGEHPKIVQERLGHSDISMTLNRYSHVTPGMQKHVADNLSAALNSAS
jgi:integrase